MALNCYKLEFSWNFAEFRRFDSGRPVARKKSVGWGGFALPLPSPPLPSSALPPRLPPLPSLRNSPPKIQLGGLGSAVSSPSGVWGWGGATAEIELGAF